MSLKKTLSVTIVAMALFVATGVAANAGAQSKNSGNVLLRYDVTVAGAHLAGGKYNIQWQTHSPEATVSFLQGSKVVATAEGKMVERETRYASNEVVYETTANGAKTLQEIRFKGSNRVIVFNE